MNRYQQIYSEATGITDISILNRIDELIRESYCGLSILCRETLEYEARLAVKMMKESGELSS